MIYEAIKRHKVPIISNNRISEGVYVNMSEGIFELTFCSEKIASAAQAGQFVNLYLPGGDMLLPRPFGISNVENDNVTIVYAIVGAGTKMLATLEANTMIDILGPNGTGFDYSKLKSNVILVGGGLGVPPLLLAAKQFYNIDNVTNTISILGYRNGPFYLEEIKNYSNDTFGVSEEFSNLNTLYAETGNVVDVLKKINESKTVDWSDTTIIACGPKPMLMALSKWCKTINVDSQFSLEERMGCGYGACVGCACTITDENGNAVRKKVCIDGPVFDGDSIIWD